MNDNLLLSLIIPLIAFVGASVIRYAIVRDIFNISISLAFLANTLKLITIYRSGEVALSHVLWQLLPNMSISFNIEPLGMLFALLVSILWPVSVIYSVGYLRANNDEHQCRFYSFFALAIFASIGIAFSANLLTIFIFYELLTICTYPLVAHYGTTEAKKAGRVYLGVLLSTSLLLLLPAILITWNIAGTVDFTKGGIFADKADEITIAILLALFVLGTAKSALMPLHKWLPAAMVAPAPVSGLLHAVAVVNAGVFVILKVIVYIFGVEHLKTLIYIDWWHGTWLLYLSSFTIIAASLVALRQDNLKKMLAYSTISQLSYMILAALLLSPKAIMAAAFTMTVHSFAKITLFFAAGSIETSAHKNKISQLNGVGRKMPWTMGAFSVAALCLIGVPPAAGFIAKWYLIEGALADEIYWVIFVIALSTLLNAAYFLPVIFRAFCIKEKPSDGITIAREYGEAPIMMVLATMFTALSCIILFFYPGVFLDFSESIVGFYNGFVRY
jgi:multicomponent Na+:H+ antiporter subunit D